jgi:hypothetical protein
MPAIKIVSVFECYNLNLQKLEALLQPGYARNSGAIMKAVFGPSSLAGRPRSQRGGQFLSPTDRNLARRPAAMGQQRQ